VFPKITPTVLFPTDSGIGRIMTGNRLTDVVARGVDFVRVEEVLRVDERIVMTLVRVTVTLNVFVDLMQQPSC
jgi:hypothetical protein